MTDYKDTVYLPKTDFSMRAGLPTKEPQILKLWEEINLFKKLFINCRNHFFVNFSR